MFRPDSDSLPRWSGNLKQYRLARFNNELKLVDAYEPPPGSNAYHQAINNQTGGTDNSGAILQVGKGNEAVNSQTGSQGASALIAQDGRNNGAANVQTGGQAMTTVIVQKGNRNAAATTQTAERAYRGLGFTEWARLPGGYLDYDAIYDEVRLYRPVPPLD
jgi:hypothetical protein